MCHPVGKGKNMSKKSSSIVAFAVFAGMAVGAAADTVNVKFLQTGLGRNVKITFGGNTTDVFAGQLLHQFSGGVGPIGGKLNGQQWTFCTDLGQFVATNFQSYTVRDVQDLPRPGVGMGLAASNAIRDIYGFAAGAQFSQVNTSNNNDFAAAFQLAVWAIAFNYDGVNNSSIKLVGSGVTIKDTSGNNISGNLLTQFNLLVSKVGLGLRDGNEVYGVSNDNFQDQLVVIPTPVPAMIAGAGLLGLAGVRRRR